MIASELRELIAQGEDSRTQFKQFFNSIDALAAEIAAMLNSNGGQILVGVPAVCCSSSIDRSNRFRH